MPPLPLRLLTPMPCMGVRDRRSRQLADLSLQRGLGGGIAVDDLADHPHLARLLTQRAHRIAFRMKAAFVVHAQDGKRDCAEGFVFNSGHGSIT